MRIGRFNRQSTAICGSWTQTALPAHLVVVCAEGPVNGGEVLDVRPRHDTEGERDLLQVCRAHRPQRCGASARVALQQAMACSLYTPLEPVVVEMFLGFILTSNGMERWRYGMRKCVPSGIAFSLTPLNLSKIRARVPPGTSLFGRSSVHQLLVLHGLAEMQALTRWMPAELQLREAQGLCME